MSTHNMLLKTNTFWAKKGISRVMELSYDLWIRVTSGYFSYASMKMCWGTH